MTIDRVALALVAALAAIWLVAMIGGAIAMWPFGIPALIVVGVVVYLFVTVLRQRLANREDDHYERNIDR